MKVIIAAVVLCVSAVYASPEEDLSFSADSHDVYQCPDPTTIATSPLCSLEIAESGQLLTTLSKTVSCPESGVNTAKIACVIVRDLIDNDDGGYSSISAGGLDQYYVDINLKSQLGKGIDFKIEVYTVASNSTVV